VEAIFQGRKENLMAVSYDKLLHLLIDRQMSNSELIKKAGFSGNVMTYIKRRKYISLDSIERICRVLDCGVDDILEFIDEDDEA
jgi:DNA-binding Xre family transcriptional regulator